jgi:hypothetical protein
MSAAASGSLHHVELWVPDLAVAVTQSPAMSAGDHDPPPTSPAPTASKSNS